MYHHVTAARFQLDEAMVVKHPFILCLPPLIWRSIQRHNFIPAYYACGNREL